MLRHLRVFFCFRCAVSILLLSFSALSSQFVLGEEPASEDGVELEIPMDRYLVNAGDVLLITIWREPELSGEILVRPDGRISFPLAGELFVEALSIEQITNRLTETLSEFIPDVSVSVSVRQTAGNTVFVLGQVNRPGEYGLNRALDVMQVLTKAGGLSVFADANSIKILRREGSQQKAIRFDYSAVMKGKTLEQNILLQSGDIIVVP